LDNGKILGLMEKEFIAGKQIKNMKDNGRMELNMV